MPPHGFMPPASLAARALLALRAWTAPRRVLAPCVLLASAALGGLAAAQSPPALREPGLSVRVYAVEGPMNRLLQLVPGQTPNVSFVAPVLDLRGERGDFGNLTDGFVTTAEGWLTVTQPGRHAFRLTSDDGSTLAIAGQLVIDADGLHSAVPVDGELDLPAGEHALLVRHFEAGGDDQLTLEWKPPGAADFALIPATALSCQAGEVRVTSPGPKQLIRPLPRGRPGNELPLAAVHPGYDLATVRPEGFEPRVGGMDFLPDGRLVLCTWDGDGAVWLLSGVQGSDRSQIKAHRLAAGLAEPLGLCVVGSRIFVLQKQELTEIIDRDNDGLADEYRCVANTWTASGNFHEFAFGLVHADGAFWANLAIAIDPGGRSTAVQAAERGSLVRITEGKHEIIARGLRAPNGIGLGPAPERAPGATPPRGTSNLPPLYITDNQGDWLPTSKLVRAARGAFYGSHAVPPYLGDNVSRPMEPGGEVVDCAWGTDLSTWDAAWPDETPPVAWLPQGEIGNSPGQPVLMRDAPYTGQILLGDVTYGGLQRVFTEVVDGVQQGCVFRFTQGLEAGVNRLVWGPDGALYIGGIGSTGNWGQEGKARFGLQRLKRNGRLAFELLAVRTLSNGLELQFTQPLAVGHGWDPDDYSVTQWRYEPTADYGGDKLDLRELRAASASVSADRRRVFLELPGMQAGHVVHLQLDDRLRADRDDLTPGGARSGADGRPDPAARLWSTEAWLTLNRIPVGRPGKVDSSPLLRTPNTLLADERDAGWKLLFDGTSLAGWHSFGKPPAAAAPAAPDSATPAPALSGWEIIDGAITRTGPGGDIATDGLYGDFELRLQWRITPGGNSGIFYRATDDHPYPWETGPEMQVLDNALHADGLNPLTSAGACYALYAPPRDNTRPVGRWNDVRLVVQGRHVEHWLNGEKLLEYELQSPEWKAAIAASKFASMPDHGTRASGRIVLQDHGDVVSYRSIAVRELPPR